MPNIKRRSFLQILGAAGLAPFLPAMPARSVVTTGGASASKALWASLYANSGSAAEFVSVAKNMGLSNTAIQGVSARTLGVRMAFTASSKKLARAGVKKVHSPISSNGTKLEIRQKFRRAIDYCFSNETSETKAIADQEIDKRVEESPIQENLKTELSDQTTRTVS